MDWLSFAADIIKAISWPICLIIIILILRKELARLLHELRHIRYKDVEINFDKQINIIKKEADNIGLPPIPTKSKLERQDIEDIIPYEVFIRIAESSPECSILLTWTDIENALKKLAKNYNIPDSLTVYELIVELFSINLFSKGEMRMIHELGYIREQVIKEKGVNLTYVQAEEYRDLAIRYIENLKSKYDSIS